MIQAWDRLSRQKLARIVARIVHASIVRLGRSLRNPLCFLSARTASQVETFALQKETHFMNITFSLLVTGNDTSRHLKLETPSGESRDLLTVPCHGLATTYLCVVKKFQDFDQSTEKLASRASIW